MIFLKFFILIIHLHLFWYLYILGGLLLYEVGSHRLGHKLVAMLIAGDFGICKKIRKWLVEHCPYSIDERSKCRCWTCSNYTDCHKTEKARNEGEEVDVNVEPPKMKGGPE